MLTDGLVGRLFALQIDNSNAIVESVRKFASPIEGLSQENGAIFWKERIAWEIDAASWSSGTARGFVETSLALIELDSLVPFTKAFLIVSAFPSLTGSFRTHICREARVEPIEFQVDLTALFKSVGTVGGVTYQRDNLLGSIVTHGEKLLPPSLAGTRLRSLSLRREAGLVEIADTCEFLFTEWQLGVVETASAVRAIYSIAKPHMSIAKPYVSAAKPYVRVSERSSDADYDQAD